MKNLGWYICPGELKCSETLVNKSLFVNAILSEALVYRAQSLFVNAILSEALVYRAQCFKANDVVS